MKPKSSVAAVVVTWNSRAVIGATIEALGRQEGVDPSILAVDNNSADGTADFVGRFGGPVHLLRNPRNLGFARAANQGIAITRTPFVAVVNPDAVLEPHALARAAEVLETKPGVASVAPWLFRSADRLSAEIPRGTVDSSGLAVTRGRRIVDRDAGRPTLDRPPGPVFGASGAFAVFRRSALEAVRYGREYFDETFFAYKEDADLAWRLSRSGWSAWFAPGVRALHARGAASRDGSIPRHQPRPLALERLSYRNHLLMLIKNERPRDLAHDLPWILFEEAGKFSYHLLRRPRVLGALRDLPAMIPETRRRRAVALSQADERASPRTAWFNHRA